MQSLASRFLKLMMTSPNPNRILSQNRPNSIPSRTQTQNLTQLRNC
jgi:hypothetical protein